MSDQDESQKDWIYRDSTKKKFMMLLLVSCVVSVLLEVLVMDRKGKFGVDGYFGFYAALGFISCTIMIFVAKLLGFALKVSTNFYGDDEEQDVNAKREEEEVSK